MGVFSPAVDVESAFVLLDSGFSTPFQIRSLLRQNHILNKGCPSIPVLALTTTITAGNPKCMDLGLRVVLFGFSPFHHF